MQYIHTLHIYPFVLRGFLGDRRAHKKASETAGLRSGPPQRQPWHKQKQNNANYPAPKTLTQNLEITALYKIPKRKILKISHIYLHKFNI